MRATSHTGNPPKICFDTESTGLDTANDRVVEIGCVRLDGRIITLNPEDRFQVYINPGFDMDDEVIAIHHITNEFLEDKPPFEAVVDDFLAFISGAELMAHNAKFDVGIINAELARLGKGRLEDYVAKITDTMDIARKVFPGRHVTMDNLCAILHIDLEERKEKGHGALLDAELLAQVYVDMTRGQNQIALESGIDPLRWGGMPEDLPVIKATSEELAEHERILGIVEKKCKSTCDWTRRLKGEIGFDAEPKTDA